MRSTARWRNRTGSLRTAKLQSIDRILETEAQRIFTLVDRLRPPIAPENQHAQADPLEEQIISLCTSCGTVAHEILGHNQHFQLQGRQNNLRMLKNAILAT